MSLARLRSGFEWLLEVITMLLVVSLAVVVLLGVTFRFTGNSLGWYDEVAAVMLAWVTYYGAALAALKRAHISVPGLVYSRPPVVRVTLVLIGEAIIITFFVLLAFYGVRTIQILGGSTLVSVPIPIAVTQSTIPIGAGLYVIAELINLPTILREAWQGRRPPSEQDIVEELQ
ncbi:TRAP transporter small permease [Halomonas rhizosphaerae]|uniref:TRAP transporter small permease protein n=1 Tax=Halomonas rhizosphaerae TaxID=3043296 RepID=A0ABT6UZ99_9GAMM|nr:TRAP transporter small permease subunit [Halomonas rhizosphaerae]MDI5891313.1 TRAP transporter small permease subunit [Halomonas rhizosphaerae]MDI5921252.1 TRAP transporter small permease subunit [Halomonas rhizosphaerae]